MSDMIEKKKRVEQIIREHADMIYRIALQNLKNPDDASDIFQDVCLSLLTKTLKFMCENTDDRGLVLYAKVG